LLQVRLAARDNVGAQLELVPHLGQTTSEVHIEMK
jgi:hypothetical protein